MHVSCSINYLESTHKNIDSSRKLSIRWLTDKWRVSRSILTAKWIKLLLLISTMKKSVFCRFMAEKTNSRFSADLGFKCIFARQESFPVIEWRMGTFVEIGNWILPQSEQNWSSLSFTLFALISTEGQGSILRLNLRLTWCFQALKITIFGLLPRPFKTSFISCILWSQTLQPARSKSSLQHTSAMRLCDTHSHRPHVCKEWADTIRLQKTTAQTLFMKPPLSLSQTWSQQRGPPHTNPLFCKGKQRSSPSVCDHLSKLEGHMHDLFAAYRSVDQSQTSPTTF